MNNAERTNLLIARCDNLRSQRRVIQLREKALAPFNAELDTLLEEGEAITAQLEYPRLRLVVA